MSVAQSLTWHDRERISPFTRISAVSGFVSELSRNCALQRGSHASAGFFHIQARFFSRGNEITELDGGSRRNGRSDNAKLTRCIEFILSDLTYPKLVIVNAYFAEKLRSLA